jgi:hypothetical protein
MYTTSRLLITILLVNGLHELWVLRKTKQRSVSRPANNSSHSGVASMCWWNHSKWPRDYSQQACNWALSVQRKCKHYWCLRIFKSMWSLGFTEPNQLSQNCEDRGMFRFADLLQADGKIFLSHIITFFHPFKLQTH